VEVEDSNDLELKKLASSAAGTYHTLGPVAQVGLLLLLKAGRRTAALVADVVVVLVMLVASAVAMVGAVVVGSQHTHTLSLSQWFCG